jgi:hypothetical protein
MSSQNNNKLYATNEDRFDTLLGDSSYLSKIYKVRNEYIDKLNQQHHVTFSNKAFYDWVANTYGIQMIVDEDGITGKYEIVDEQKFLLFNLKYV